MSRLNSNSSPRAEITPDQQSRAQQRTGGSFGKGMREEKCGGATEDYMSDAMTIYQSNLTTESSKRLTFNG